MHTARELIGSFSLCPMANEQLLSYCYENVATYFFFRLMDRLSRWKVSCIRSNLTLLSKGLSVPKLDKWLTSMSHGLSF